MRNLSLTVGAACTILSTGCYTLQPVGGAAPIDGQRVGFDISDAGRVALGGAMGPSIARIEGRLVRREANEMVIAVSSVRFINGGEQTWTGEPVRVRPEYVNTTYVRKLSKGRTIAAGAVAAGAIAFIITRGLNGGGTEDNPRPPRDSIGTTYRGPRP